MKKLITVICFLLLVGFTAVCAAVMAKTQEQISQDETDGKLKCGKDSSDVQSSENSGEMQQTGFTLGRFRRSEDGSLAWQLRHGEFR